VIFRTTEKSNKEKRYKLGRARVSVTSPHPHPHISGLALNKTGKMHYRVGSLILNFFIGNWINFDQNK
jgi:hypothetical protein